MVTASPSSSVRCWSCHADTHGQPFCPSCAKIAQRPAGATHFDLFGLRPSVELDLAPLEKQYRELSLKLHPDRFAQADARERRLSLEWTTALNDAFRTLKDPVRRAIYLIKLHGVDLEREDAGAHRHIPLEFLEEIMALREELHEAGLAKAQTMAVDVEKKKKAALADAQVALRRLVSPETDEVEATALQIATHALARVRYFQRFLEEVSAREEEAL